MFYKGKKDQSKSFQSQIIVNATFTFQHLSPSSCTRSVADIGDQGLPILSEVSFPDELQ